MNLKSLVIGAVISLIVTVLGGLLIFFFTKEPEFTNKERLVYSFELGGFFSGENTSLAISSLNLSNIGGKVARNLEIELEFQDSLISDFSINKKLKKNKINLSKDRKLLRIELENLRPKETILINAIIGTQETPLIDIKSENTIASDYQAVKDNNSKDFSKFYVFLPPLFATIFLSLFYFFYIKKRLVHLFGSRNNSGFILLHNGLVS